jgi:hypothetical protein
MMSQASPSWVMTKFWFAATVGAPIYFLEELLAYCRLRIRNGKVLTKIVDVD